MINHKISRLSCLLLSLVLFACSNQDQIDDESFEFDRNPELPTEKDQLPQKGKGSPLLFTTGNLPPLEKSFQLKTPGLVMSEPSDSSDFSSIMAQNGYVLTVWALAPRNWLWAYPPIDSHYFGNIRNWRVERSFRRGYFRFVNQALGTCMEVYGNGVIHSACNPKSLDQDFELLPTDTGSIFIKSVSQQRCLTYDAVNTGGFSTIILDDCDDNITPLHDQNWYLAPPLLPAVPLN